MNEIYQDHECACLARFRSDDELTAHIEEYQSRERYHSLEAERCRTHTRASDDNDQGSSSVEGGEVMPETETVSRKSRNCPHPSCEAKPAFGSRLALRRHFLQHIEVIEVCVGCDELFRLASQFVRHIEQHNDNQHTAVCNRKLAYIRNTCQELRGLADERLYALEKGMKRPLASPEPQPSQRAKLDHPDITQSFPIQNANGMLYHTPLDTSLMSISDGPVDSGITQLSCNFMDGTMGSLAPVFNIVNFPQIHGGDQGNQTVAYRE